MQAMGENVVGLVQEFGRRMAVQTGESKVPDTEKAVFFDVLGLIMVHGFIVLISVTEDIRSCTSS